MSKTCIIISGPTAVGKTALAIQLAKHFGTDIISADSRQCFRELNIGVAKPSPHELEEVKHYFINSHSIHEEVNAASFESYALAAVSEIFHKKDVAVMVGGTGLYIRSFVNGIDPVSETDPIIRAQIIRDYETKGLEWLQQQLQAHDPLFYSKGEMQNPQRMMRALEVKRSTGKSIFEFHTKPRQQRDFKIIPIGLDIPREQLYRRINQRVDMMMETGLLSEVESLLPYKSLNALQTVGYRELFEYFTGSISLADAVEKIKTNTRHYAKRQLTWFRRDETIRWCKPGTDEVIKVIAAEL